MTQEFDHAAHAQKLKQTQLFLLGVPWELAGKCAEIVLSKKAEEQSEEERILIQKAYQFITAV